jgi:hypothetical protein
MTPAATLYRYCTVYVDLKGQSHKQGIKNGFPTIGTPSSRCITKCTGYIDAVSSQRKLKGTIDR